MAITTAVTTTSSVSWTIKDVSVNNNNNYYNDIGQGLYSVNFVDGSGSLGGVNLKYNKRWSLVSGEDTTFDLTNLTEDLFGTQITKSMTGLKDCLLLNHETGVNSRISVLSTGTNSFTNLFDGGSGNLIVHPKSAFHRTIWTSGINVTADNKNLIIRDVGGMGADVQIVLVGTSG